MINTPVFGFEKLFLENLRRELESNSTDVYFDDFENLIVQKNQNGKNKFLVAMEVSENAFLVSDISDDGYVKISPLFEFKSSNVGDKVIINNRIGFIVNDDKASLKVDFGVKDRKSAEKFLKLGDTMYVKPFVEQSGDAFFTNSKSFLLKDIVADIIKNTKKTSTYAFLREGKKGAYALGKNVPAETSYFISFVEDLKTPAAFIKKEGDFISSYKIDDDPVTVLKTEKTSAGSYYLASGGKNIIGVGIRCENLKNGLFKVYISDIQDLIKMCKL